MSSYRCRLTAIMFSWCAAVGFVLPVARGDDETPPNAERTEAAKPQPSAEQIKTWIEQLDSDRFATRQKATERLKEAGQAAIEPVVAAAEMGSLEVTSRAISILAHLLESKTAATSQAARAALEKLQKSTNDAARRLAGQAIKPAPDDAPAVPVRPGIPNAGGIQIIAGGARNVAVKSTTKNGNREIEITEDGTKIKIIEAADKKIEVAVTAKVDGKEKTTKYTAKDADELKKKHPEAHKYYEKYAKGGAALQIGGRILPIQIQQAIAAARQRVPRPVPRAVQQQAVQQIEAAQAELKKATERLRELAKAGAKPEELTKTLEQIQAAMQKLAEAQKGLSR